MRAIQAFVIGYGGEFASAPVQHRTQVVLKVDDYVRVFSLPTLEPVLAEVRRLAVYLLDFDFFARARLGWFGFAFACRLGLFIG